MRTPSPHAIKAVMAGLVPAIHAAPLDRSPAEGEPVFLRA